MPFTVTMPKLTPTMEEGTVASWSKKEGEFVEVGETMVEIATDKATVEHTALDEGYLRKILVPDGEEAVVGQPIAVFTEKKDESIEGYKPEGVAPEKEEEAPVAVEGEEEAAPAAVPTKGLGYAGVRPAPPHEEWHPPAPKERIAASPLARKLAAEKGLDISTVDGSGPGGRVVERDLAHAQPGGLVTFDRHERPSLPPGTFEEEKLTPIRKVIGQRLQEAKTFIPHFYVTQEIDAGPIMALREQLKSQGLKVSFNDIVVRATALMLRRHPNVNSGYNSADDTIVRFKTIDVSVAVSMDEGLITPIIRHADYKSLGAISLEIKELAGRARHGKLMPEEYTGGSFTVSNLGMYGITEFAGVINPPQVGILSVGGIRQAPVVRDGAVVPGHLMNMTVSADHRVADGAVVAAFLKDLRHLLDNPAPILL